MRFGRFAVLLGLFVSQFALAVTNDSSGTVDEWALKQQQLANPPTPAATPVGPMNVAGYSGDNTAGNEWARPFADGTCCSGLGPVRYTTQVFSLSSNDICNISSTQTGFDGYIFVYTSPFDPLNQTVNFVAGDDDGNGGIGTSDIENLALTGNTLYVLVTTGFANGDEGPFSNTISCPTATVTLGVPLTAPTPVPVFGPFAIFLLTGLMGVFGSLFSRKRS